VPESCEAGKCLATQAKDDPLENIHREIGYNYWLTNLQAALGCAQMEQLDDYLAAKRRIADTYREAFADAPGITPMPQATWASSVFWMYTVLVDEADYGPGSRALCASWRRRESSAARSGRPCIYLLPMPGTLTPARWRKTSTAALSLPCSVGLTVAQQAKVIEVVKGRK
jgi:dTDP-4-amino-4,6-dideoxygalactose transaminase